MAFNVETITGYVEEHKSELIGKAVLGAKTISMLNWMTGIKGATKINLIDTDAVIQNGEACGFAASGDSKITQREIDPKLLKVNMEYCPKTLLNTYLQHEVKIGAGRETLPFEAKLTEGIAESVASKLEKMIWKGNATNDNEFDGIVTILNSAATNVVTEATGTTASKAILDTYMAIPSEVVSKGDVVIFVSEGTYRKYIQELVASNKYHYDPKYADGEYVVEGTNVKVVAVTGLIPTTADTTEYIVASSLSNLFYGTDLAGDEETFDIWFSKDERVYKVAIEWLSGAQIAYPSEVVLTKVALK